MTITVRHRGRYYEWRKSNNNWFTDKNNVVTSKSLKDQLSRRMSVGSDCQQQLVRQLIAALEAHQDWLRYVPKRKGHPQEETRGQVYEQGRKAILLAKALS